MTCPLRRMLPTLPPTNEPNSQPTTANQGPHKAMPNRTMPSQAYATGETNPPLKPRPPLYPGEAPTYQAAVVWLSPPPAQQTSPPAKMPPNQDAPAPKSLPETVFTRPPVKAPPKPQPPAVEEGTRYFPPKYAIPAQADTMKAPPKPMPVVQQFIPPPPKAANMDQEQTETTATPKARHEYSRQDRGAARMWHEYETRLTRATRPKCC